MKKTTQLQVGNVFVLPRHLEARLYAVRRNGRVWLALPDRPDAAASAYCCKEWVAVAVIQRASTVDRSGWCTSAPGWRVMALMLDDFGEFGLSSPILCFEQGPTWSNSGVVEPLAVLRTVPVPHALPVSLGF